MASGKTAKGKKTPAQAKSQKPKAKRPPKKK